MQVVTTVKTTMQEVKKALRLLNPNLPTEFVLDIECYGSNTETSQAASVKQVTPWYPDNSGEWIETFGKQPEELKGMEVIEILRTEERYCEQYTPARYIAVAWKFGWHATVAYKLVKKGN